MGGVPTFPHEVSVVGGVITIRFCTGEVVTTGDIPGAYKISYDIICKFLINDIGEEEVLAEAEKLAEEQSELEKLRKEADGFAENFYAEHKKTQERRRLVEEVSTENREFRELRLAVDEIIRSLLQEPWYRVWSMKGTLRSLLGKLWEKTL